MKHARRITATLPADKPSGAPRDRDTRKMLTNREWCLREAARMADVAVYQAGDECWLEEEARK
jgi:hypothetical protein